MNDADKKRIYRQKFFSELSRRLAHADEEYPTTRCWSHNSLRQFLSQIRGHLLESKLIPSSFERSEQLIQWLEEIGIAYRIPVQGGSSSRGETAFFIIALGAGADSIANPYELLQAFEPKGTITYFSALSFHGLTTQPAPFHHIAKLNSRPEQPRLNLSPTVPRFERSIRPAPNPLGTLGFRLDGIEFYVTCRRAKLVHGIEVHVLNSQTRLRTTDLEQSLLDTLMNPLACGGDSVILECWDEGWPKVRIPRILHYLQESDLPLVRRFGALRYYLNLEVPEDIAEFLRESQQKLEHPTSTPFQLFRGGASSTLNADWQVWVPS